MHASVPHLQSAIRAALNKGALCRIYEDSLKACWPNVTAEARMQAMTRFAEQNHWTVTVRTLGAMGTVAEFQKAEAHA